MRFIDSIRSRIGMQPEEERKTFTYECDACSNRFESPVANRRDVQCPNCGDHNVREAETL